MGLRMQSDFEKSNGIIWFENPIAYAVRLLPNIRPHDPSDYQIAKWHRSLLNLKTN